MDALACLLIDTAKIVKGRLTQTLKTYNITCRQAVVLRALDGESLPAKKIADMCSMDKATLSTILNKLIAHGFVACTANQNDKRENSYAITDEGKTILPLISSVERDYRRQIQKHLTDDEYAQLMILLEKVQQIAK